MIQIPVIDSFLEASVRSATPLAYAALGELIAERSGVINIGLEGSIVCGALAALVVAQAVDPSLGFVAGGVAGAALALIFAFFVITLRAQQIVAGAAVSMLGLGVSATIHRSLVSPGDPGIHVATMPALRIPLLADLPVVGPALFAQPAPTYLLYLLYPLVGWLLYRTIGGIALRATGEYPAAVVTGGHSPRAIQFVAVLLGGALAGLGGATLVVAHSGTFSDGMSAGRGFVAIAIVALGRWKPVGVAIAAMVFGGVSALQFLAQAMGWPLAYNVVLAAPYVLTLAAMAVVRGSRAAPAALGRPLEGPN